jgi:hypothetical protein
MYADFLYGLDIGKAILWSKSAGRMGGKPADFLGAIE